MNSHSLSRLFITALILFSTTTLQAYSCYDDYPVNWNGFYLNGQLGMGANREHTKFVEPNFFNTLGTAVLGNDFSRRSQGIIGGGALGYNYQSGYWLVGLEGGCVSANLRKSYPSPFFPTTDTFSSHLQCIATGKLRIGYAFDSLLTYVSGGWAGGHDVVKFSDPSTNTFAKLRTWINGWTAGVGFDCKFADCYSMGLGYDYIQFDYRKETACPRCGTGIGFGTPTIDNRLHIQTLTLRFNYFFST